MVRDPAYGLSPEAVEYVRQRYQETDDSVSNIAADVGKSRGTIYNLANAQGWQLRRDRPARGLPEALQLDIDATKAEATQAAANKASPAQAEECNAGPGAAADPDSVAARLEAAVERELCKVESLRGPPPGKRSIEAERVARTLATLTETLFKLRRLQQPGGLHATDDDDLPKDPDAFRLALAERIEKFVRSRIDGSLPERDRRADGEPAGS